MWIAPPLVVPVVFDWSTAQTSKLDSSPAPAAPTRPSVVTASSASSAAYRCIVPPCRFARPTFLEGCNGPVTAGLTDDEARREDARVRQDRADVLHVPRLLVVGDLEAQHVPACAEPRGRDPHLPGGEPATPLLAVYAHDER